MGYWGYYEPKVSDRNRIKSTIKDIDEEILKYLFCFNPTLLDLYFDVFENKYGTSAANYARKVFPKWKCGEIRYSAKSIERFIDLVPKFLSHDQRYEILRKLYERTRNVEYYSVEIVLGHTDQNISKIEGLYKNLCEKPQKHVLPDQVVKLMNWVCDHNSIQARNLMAAIEIEHSRVLSAAAKVEVQRLKYAIQNIEGKVIGNHLVDLPYGRISISIRKPKLTEKVFKFLGR